MGAAPHIHLFWAAHIALSIYTVPHTRIWGTVQTNTIATRIFTN